MIHLTPAIASAFRSDGGTMFGLVPKAIWSKRIFPDDRNFIAQNANFLLVELADGRRGIVDSGCGADHKFSEKERALHGLGPGWPLMDALQRQGWDPAKIDFVIFSHLHWDHAGGALSGLPDSPGMTFPNARHIAHALEWEDALSGNELLYKSYPKDIVAGLEKLPEDQLILVEDANPGVLPGVQLIRSSGHTRGHSTIVFTGDLAIHHPDAVREQPAQMALFAGDVCPTRHHLRMVFQTSYDTFPLDTRAWKREWLPRLAQEQAWLFYDHDPDVSASVIAADEKEEFRTIQNLRISPPTQP